MTFTMTRNSTLSIIITSSIIGTSLFAATACTKRTEPSTQDALQLLIISQIDFNRSHQRACAKDADCSMPLVCTSGLCQIPPSITNKVDDATPKLTFSTGDDAHSVYVEIASDDYSRQRGMMNRKSCHPDWGMLFIFPNELRRSFWMSHTYLPLDIVFIDQDGTLSSFYKNAKPLDERPRYTSNKRVRYVLELPAGSIERFGIDNSTTFDTTQFNQYKAE